ncbi:hypothetical protein CKF46_37870 [Klebsiella pneumoniae]|nr:hypothetical protein CKF46_37870 [Klebsiella pneumoniae]
MEPVVEPEPEPEPEVVPEPPKEAPVASSRLRRAACRGARC